MPENDARRRYHHGNLRQALIEAGREALAEEGIAGLDLRQIARRAGVSHAAPYRHFTDKQALLAAVAEDGFSRLTARIAETLGDESDGTYTRIAQLAEAYVGFARENPAHMREMFSGLTICRIAYPMLYTAAKAAFAQFVTVMQEGQARGEIAGDDPVAAALVAWSLLHGLAMLVIEDQIPDTGDDAKVAAVIRLHVDTLYYGLCRSDVLSHQIGAE